MMFFIAMLLATAEPSMQAIVEPAGGTVGFAAVELASGRELGLKQDEPFPMQSVFKLPIAIEVLRQVDEGKIDLDREILLGAHDAGAGVTTIVVPSRRTVRKLLEAMVVNSDNVACDRLLALVGGSQAVDARMRGLGIEGITIRFSEREMTAGKGDNTATPAAMVALLVRMARQGLGLLPASAKHLEDLLLQVGTGAKRIKGACHPACRSPTRPEPRAPKTAGPTPPTTPASSLCRTGTESPSWSSFTTPLPTSERARKPSPSWREPRTTRSLPQRCTRRFPTGYQGAGGETPPTATAS
jgi:Beta-lactamase enzyme family